MHFSIPETVQATDDNGSKYWNFHIHVNGVFHCKLRYSQMDKFYEQATEPIHNMDIKVQLRSDFPDRVPTKLFPGKKLFSLTADQLEERRENLERFIQHISQDPVIGVSDQFNDFFLKAQQNRKEIKNEEVSLDVYLMNGNKVSVAVMNTDQTDDVLEAAMKKIGLADKFFYYFALFLVERGSSGGISIVRKLQDFESPYLSLSAVDQPHRIVIRKNYWATKYDDNLLEDRIAMNLLYVQITDDLDRGWMLCTEKDKTKLDKLQAQGSRKEVLKLARKFKFYGYMHFQPCIANYPQDDSRVLMSAGEREFNIRMKTDDDKMLEGSFKVQRIRSWRLTSIPYSDENEDKTKESLQFAFEYLFSKSDLKWITVKSNQAIMMSMAMQGIVDEILREQEGKGIRQPRGDKKRSGSDSSSSSSETKTTTTTASNSSNQKSSDNNTTTSTASKVGSRPIVHSKMEQDKTKSRKQPKRNQGGMNEVFAGNIGDEDL